MPATPHPRQQRLRWTRRCPVGCSRFSTRRHTPRGASRRRTPRTPGSSWTLGRGPPCRVRNMWHCCSLSFLCLREKIANDLTPNICPAAAFPRPLFLTHQLPSAPVLRASCCVCPQCPIFPPHRSRPMPLPLPGRCVPWRTPSASGALRSSSLGRGSLRAQVSAESRSSHHAFF